MAKMFTSGFKPKSTTKSAKHIIRAEIKSCYSPSVCGGGRSALDNMKNDADSYSGGKGGNDWQKGSALVDGGCFAIYYDDQKRMLGKIYGNDNVAKWDGKKTHNTYRSLIGREYSAMLREKKRGEKL